jgi:apolipoprotein N-acyltransferase
MTHSLSTELPAPKFAFVRTGLLLFFSVVLLSLAADPVGLWFLAWFALAPWLVAIGEAPTMRAALARGWLAGIAYFSINLWWLWTASMPGTIVLVVYFALYWSLAAGLLRGLGLLVPKDRLLEQEPSVSSDAKTFSHREFVLSRRVLGIAVVWVASEWLRCNVASGLPWFPLGTTQAPLLVMCQVADLGGPWIVSFWVALPSALLATAWFERDEMRLMRMPVLVFAAILTAVAIYGSWRLLSTNTVGGPRVMVIQSNFPHLPGGAPTVDRQQAVEV